MSNKVLKTEDERSEVGLMPPTPMQTPDRLMALAIEHGADVEKLERLMSLQERWQAQQSKAAFFDALSHFQAACPDIPQGKVVLNRDGSERYRYAPLDSILKAIRGPLRECGLSVRWEPGAEDDDSTTTVCIVTHASGHSERSSVRIPGIVGHGTNKAQDAAGAITYGRRYSLLNALGIQADSDTDAREVSSGHLEVLLRQMDCLRQVEICDVVRQVKLGLSEGGCLESAAESYAALTPAEVNALWVAPSKGGIWSTAERKRIKTDTEFQGHVHRYRESSDWHNRERQT